jgi:predicted nucleic acid-binding protein
VTVRRYVIDTQLYIDYFRERPIAAAFQDFAAAFAPALLFHAVVSAELLFGARSSTEERRIRQALLERFGPTRTLVPTGPEWWTTGDVVRRMAAAGHDPVDLQQRDFFNDILVAVTCRIRGAVLVTSDRDHDRIRPHVRHLVVPPFPQRQSTPPRGA